MMSLSFFGRLYGITILTCALGSLGNPADSNTRNPDQGQPGDPEYLRDPELSEPANGATGDWYVQLSAALISKNDIGKIFSGGLGPAEGKDAGEVYSLSVNYVAHRFEIPTRHSVLRPQFEPYARLTLVDENSNPVFPDYNAGVGFRWVDFPWDRWVDTSFYMGVGLSYSSQVFAMDRVRHPGEDRSHLKIDWPIQLCLALPRWPQHQLVLFIDHQSGGHIFDEGGVNAVGAGYQFQF